MNTFTFTDDELSAVITCLEITADSLFEMGDYSAEAFYRKILQKLSKGNQ